MKTRKDPCAHCGFEIGIRNPSGFCDHLYYPENCNTCSGRPHIKDPKRMPLFPTVEEAQRIGRELLSETIDQREEAFRELKAMTPKQNDAMVKEALKSLGKANADIPKDRSFMIKPEYVQIHKELINTLHHLLNQPELLTDDFYRKQIKELLTEAESNA